MVILKLEEKINQAITDGYKTFISGMAWGVDIWAAETILELKKVNTDLKLISAIPFDGFEAKWSNEWKKRYENIRCNADYVKYICPNYQPNCFIIRNKWMVNHSARIIAVYNGTPGGTRNTVTYANQAGLDIITIQA